MSQTKLKTTKPMNQIRNNNVTAIPLPIVAPAWHASV
jgi:hypothetical protein